MKKTYKDFVKDLIPQVKELFPWDLGEMLGRLDKKEILLLDIREPYEFDSMKVEGSLNVPRGILEAACDYDYEETLPELVEARQKTVVVICRSGNRSVLAAHTLSQMGFEKVYSLKTGLRGWHESDEPLTDAAGNLISADNGDMYFNKPLSPEKRTPKQG